MRFIHAARAGDVPPGASRVIEAAGRRVLLAHWEGAFFAFAPVCPHRGNPLDGAQVYDGQLECPWHHFRYDLHSGRNIYPSNVYPLGASDIDPARLEGDLASLRTYPLEVRDGELFVALGE